MAYLQARKNKQGQITSYSIRVSRGVDKYGRQRKPFTTSFKVKSTWSEKTAYSRALAYALEFENQCKAGYEADNRQTFEEYADYVLQTKMAAGILKSTTAGRYEEMTKRIYPEIGYMKLKEIRPQHLNRFYMDLLNTPLATAKSFIAKPRLRQVISQKGISKDALSKMAVCSPSTVTNAVEGIAIREDKAEAIAKVLDCEFNEVFTPKPSGKTLSPKTVREYHRFISSILSQAEKELIVPYNAASKATPPKLVKKDVNYFEPEEIHLIEQGFDKQPIRIKTLGYMLIFTGVRRGELLGMEWHNVDWEKSTIRIEKNVLYMPQRGIYVDTPKTETSKRKISLPSRMMTMLKEYKDWVETEKERIGWSWNSGNDFIFTSETGDLLHPDTVSKWLRQVENSSPDIPHLNSHAFRHSVASALIYHGVDPVSVSKRLGHASVSTTTNLYAHLMSKADEQNAAILDQIF